MKKILTTAILFLFVLVPINSAKAATITVQSCKFNSTYFVSSKYVNSISSHRVYSGCDWVYKVIPCRVTNVIKLPAPVLPSTPSPVPSPEPRPIPAPVPTPAPVPNPEPAPAPIPNPQPSQNNSALQAEMLSYINAERAKANLQPLTLDDKLSNGAYLKSQDMAVNNYFSHNSPTYGTPFEMMKNQGIAYRTAGENIAKHTSVKGAHNAFMNSPGHKANILNSNFNKIGLGFYQSGSYIYVTQWFTN